MLSEANKEAFVSNATRVGFAFAITVASAYVICTLVFWTWPQAATSFMNGLFHGLDFSRLQSAPGSFSFQSFIYVLVVLGVWAFLLGVLFAWVFARVGGAPNRA